MEAQVTLTVDGERRTVSVDTRTTLLDALRDRLGIYSPKKGCDHGQCGSCTVLVDGRRVTTCLSLAVAQDGVAVVTAAGLARAGDSADGDTADDTAGADDTDGELHPMQRAFIDQDGFQCGYCTPGQVCSAVGMLDEVASGMPSHVTEDLTGEVQLTDTEIRERMSGNLCRCAAYPNILAAIRQAASEDVGA